MMRNSLRNLVLAAGLMAFPLSASALEVRSETPAEAPVKTYESERVSFQYGDGQIVSQQLVRNGDDTVEQITIQYVDPVSGVRSRDAFLSLSIYERPPVVEGAGEAEDAILKNLIASLQRSLGQNIAPQAAEMTVPGFGEVNGYHLALPTSSKGAREALFFAKKVATGYALVFVQYGENDQAIQDAMDGVLQSLSFGEK